MSVAALEHTWANERKGYIRCKAIGHSWFDYDSNWKPLYGTPITLRCERCGMERRESVTATGMLIPGSRHYYRPPHYKLERGEWKPSKADFRMMLLALRDQESKPKRKKSTA